MSGKLISDYRIAGNLVFAAGTTGQPGDVETQIRKTFEKLRKVLEEAGTSFENVVKANVYLADIADRKKHLNAIWRETFPNNPPARTCVQATMDPGVAVEIEMIAKLPEK
ncbi:MAG: RidA family protein [Candidatus Bathyarchaeota archaeon]|nr:RidA family protein [Candidatus Bathyarchaeota archaeon]